MPRISGDLLDHAAPAHWLRRFGLREIGIRTALGARPESIVGAVVRRAFVQLVVGIAARGCFSTC